MSFSDFDDSDLTDLSSDEDDYVPLAQVTKKGKTPSKAPKSNCKETYTIKQELRPPRNTQYSARSLYEQILESSIDLDPDYQRDVVWPETKQIGLIDSIFRNYYIPPVIFSVSTTDDGTETRTCIDGKQRLTSIQKFMDGLIPHRDSVTGKKYWYKQAGTTKRTCLPKSIRQAFANKQIVCVEYDNIPDDQEREIFQRVQLGVALTPAERMSAITGPWPTFIREIQSEVLGEEGFGASLDWGQTRGRDFQGLVSIVFMIEKLPTFTTPVSPALDKWLQRTTAVPAQLRKEVLDTFRIFMTLTKDKKYNAPFHKPSRISPIEFVMIGVLIYSHRTNLSYTQLSSAIEQMRADVRAREKDVRTNTRVTKFLFQFIRNKVKPESLKSDGKGDKPAATSVPAPSTGMHAPNKRKRVESSDDDVEEGEEWAPRARGRPKTTVPVTAASRPSQTGPSQTVKSSTKSTAKATSAKTTKTSKSVKQSPASSVQLSPIIPSQHAPASARATPVHKRPPVPPPTNAAAQSTSASAPVRVKLEPDGEPELFPSRLAAIRAAKNAASQSPKRSPPTGTSLPSFKRTSSTMAPPASIPPPQSPSMPPPMQPSMPPPMPPPMQPSMQPPKPSSTQPPAPLPAHVPSTPPGSSAAPIYIKEEPMQVPIPPSSPIDLAKIEAILAAAGIGAAPAPQPPAHAQRNEFNQSTPMRPGYPPNGTPNQNTWSSPANFSSAQNNNGPISFSLQNGLQSQGPPAIYLPPKPLVDLSRSVSSNLNSLKASPLGPQYTYPPVRPNGSSSGDLSQQPPPLSASSTSSFTEYRRERSTSRERGRDRRYDREYDRGYPRGRGRSGERGLPRESSRGGSRYEKRDRDRDWYEGRHAAHKGWTQGPPPRERGGERVNDRDQYPERRRSGPSRWDPDYDKTRVKAEDTGREWDAGWSQGSKTPGGRSGGL